MNWKGGAMKLLALFTMAALCASAVHAQPVVTIPSGRLKTSLAVPIKIDLPDGSRKQFDIGIESEGTNLIQVSASGDIEIRSISTRFQALSANVGVSVAAPSAAPYRTERTLDLPAPAVIPEDRHESTATIGGSEYTFVRGGKEIVGRITPGKFVFVIKNAASRKHFVNEVEVELTKADQRSTMRIKGSPYWYEPLMEIEGDFETGKILQVVAEGSSAQTPSIGRRLEFPTFSIEVPNWSSWSRMALKQDPLFGEKAETVIWASLSRSLPAVSKSGEPPKFMAFVSLGSKKFHTVPATSQELLANEIREFEERLRKMGGHKNISVHSTSTRVSDSDCLQYFVTYEIHQTLGALNPVYDGNWRGLICADGSTPGSVIRVDYSERVLQGHSPLSSIEQEAKQFLESLIIRKKSGERISPPGNSAP